MVENKSALICENDPVQLKVLRAVFDRAGYRTTGARSPAEALRHLEDRAADLIVSDVLLDEGNAFDLLGGARRIGRDAPMIMISAFATETLRARAISEGVDSVLEKSPGHHELMVRAGQLVRRPRRQARGARVLLVEDQEAVGTLLLAGLAKAGFRTSVARDARAARAAVSGGDGPVDMALVDLGFPGAADLIRELRGVVPGLYVAALEGAGNPASIRAAYRAGATTIFGRPLRADPVAETLTRAVDQAREARRVAEVQAGEPRLTRAAHAVGAWFVGGRRKVLHRTFLAAAGILAGVVTASLFDQALRIVDRSSERADRALQVMEARLMAPYGGQQVARPLSPTMRPSLPPMAPANDRMREAGLVDPLDLLGDDLMHPRTRALTEPSWNRGAGGFMGTEGRR